MILCRGRGGWSGEKLLEGKADAADVHAEVERVAGGGHESIVHTGFLGRCPLCVATFERAMMANALEDLANGRADLKKVVERLRNVNIFLNVPREP